MPNIGDSHRGVKFISPLGDGVLVIREFEGRERLGRLFEFELELRSEDEAIALADVLGQNVTVEMELVDGAKRYFNGFVTDFSYQGTVGNLAVYRATMKPWLWFLSRTADCRIFQEMTVPDIIKQVFRDNGLTDWDDKLSRTYGKREYCVQYRETDLEFVSRLMEKEGIYYYFKHEEGKHTLVLSDGYSSHDVFPNFATVPYFPLEEFSSPRERDHIQEWNVGRTVVPGQFVLQDFYFEKPKVDLIKQSKQEPGHDYPISEHEMFDYPGGYREGNDGDQYVRTINESWGAQHERARGDGNARGMCSGYLFTLEDLPREDQNREYLIIGVTHRLHSDHFKTGSEDNDEFYHCWVEAMDSQTPYRSRPVTPTPVVWGPQTATVVGPAREEIWCDKYGRVKLQFHWDRYGQHNENSSCWVRVSQLWAGKTWGGIHIPRIGQEVVVSFLEGDPDQPLVTGRVYNADYMPPYELPANQTQSGIKSRSSQRGSPETFNELRFEDLKDKEEVYFQAQKDLNSVIKNKETRKIWGPRETEIGVEKAVDEVITPGKLGESTTINADKKTVVKGDDRLEVAEKGSKGRNVQIKMGDHALKVDLGNISRDATAGKVTETAAQSIELKVGPSSIKIDNTGITIKGPMIKIEGDADAKMSAPMVTVEGKGMAAFKSTGMTQIDGSITTVNAKGVLTVKGALLMLN